MIRFAILLVALHVLNCAAAPFVPKSDDEVLEKLATRPGDPKARALKAMRVELARDPRNLDVAVQLAQRYFEEAAAEGDPRFVGYAQAALTPWWSMPSPPVEVLVLRATLAQYRHDFAGALADLSAALEREPTHAQAWSLSATIKVVQADYDAARRDCAALAPLVVEAVAVGCGAFIDGLTGNARQAHAALTAALARTSRASPQLNLWVWTRLAEMAWRLGDGAQAEAHFRQALALGLTDGFLLAAYADFLLDQRRPGEVLALLKDKTRADPLLLRVVLAEKLQNSQELAKDQATLADRYAAARLRGDKTHEQEEARFDLHVLGQAAEALRLASSNWQVQREPRDARILLEAAIATGTPAAAAPVLDWMQRSRIEDASLQRLAAKMSGRR
jgi:tetratricopeptide (TPR) repeat protein